MTEVLNTLIKKQERKIFTLKRPVLFHKKAKCPGCHNRIVLQHKGEGKVLCFFCSDCQLLFER